MKRYFIHRLIVRSKPATGIAFLCTCMLLLSAPESVLAQDRLIPSEEVAKIQFTYRFDGRALSVSVANGSQLVVTGGSIACASFDQSRGRPRRAPNGKEWCWSKGEPVDLYFSQEARGGLGKVCEFSEPISYSINETVGVRKTRTLYFEAPAGMQVATFCEAKDLRGRSPKLWDF
jgi:hypothetical protein